MGTLKGILGFAVIAVALYTCWEVIPPELANYQYQDDLRDIAMMAAANPSRSEEDLRVAAVKKAQERNISLQAEQVTVQRIGSVGAVAFYIAADYSVPVDLPGYSFTLHFTPSSGNRGF
ncbi:MAG TPA: hypothetical protein VFO39_08690 [Candidatus Sulfotelmatobacter sp.]|nr:hypothetical protein [Candidatus Sulfotelmatobacter sp.]